MAALSNHFPAMTPEELDEFRRHSGMYIVTHWDERHGCYVSSRYRSIAYALDVAGVQDSPEERRRINASLGNTGAATLDAGAPGYPVTIYTPDPWAR